MLTTHASPGPHAAVCASRRLVPPGPPPSALARSLTGAVDPSLQVAHLSSSAQAADARDFSPLLVRLDASRRASALGSRVDG